MAVRNYSATAAATTISASLTNVATSTTVASTSGFPAAPFIGRLDPDTASEEIVLVTNVAGLVLTLTRGYDSTSAVAHASGATFRHSVSAIDLREPNTHINSGGAVHGLSGNIVGTTDVQTLTNKTLTSPTITGPTITTATMDATTLTVGTVPVALTTSTLGRKNALINAVGFPVSQRGAGPFAASGYTLDMWKLAVGTGATVNILQGAPVIGTVAGYAPHMITWSRAVAGSTASTLTQNIEDVSTFAGQTVTFSIGLNASANADISVSLVQNFGTGGSPSGSVTTAGPTFTATTTQTTFTWTVAVPSITGKTLGVNGNDSLQLVLTRPTTGNGPTVAIGITACQLELGSAATPFEVMRPGEVLALCQRYFYRLPLAASCPVSMGHAFSTTGAYGSVPHPEVMRAAPTPTQNGANSDIAVVNIAGTLIACSAALTFTVTAQTMRWTATVASGLTNGNATALQLNSGSPSLDFSAEL